MNHLATVEYQGENYKLFSSHHQDVDRMGLWTYDEIYDKYWEMHDRGWPIRIGVPNDAIVRYFEAYIDVIVESFKTLRTGQNRIIFMTDDETYEVGHPFSFIEFVLQKNGNDFTIITSAFSKDGSFLFNVDRHKKVRLLESSDYDLLKVIRLI